MQWHRDEYARAVWSSTTLKPLERLVALAFADHARDETFAFVTYVRLQRVTGLSRDAVARALKGLIAAGWLELKEAGTQHKAPRYWLRIPSQRSARQTTDEGQASARQTAAVTSSPGDGSLSQASSPSPAPSSPSPAPSSPSPAPSSPRDGLEQPADHSADQQQLAREAKIQRGADQVALILGACEDAHEIAERVLARKPDVEDLAKYIAGIPPDDLAKKYRAQAPRVSSRAGAEKCPHNVAGGSRVIGRGDNRSRVCGSCEAADPAAKETAA